MSIRALVVAVEDPPLSATERTLAACTSEVVLRGLGQRALEYPRAQLFVEAEGQARAELERTATSLEASLRFETAPRATSLRLRPSTLAETVWRERGAPRIALTVAGAVESPQVIAAPAEASIDALVEAARPSGRAWVALWGGALVERSATIASVLEARPQAQRLLLILPTRHALARRARAPLSTWLRRAQSACSACDACTPTCAQGIPVAQLLRGLTAGGRVRPGTATLSTTTACTGCGACDLACPVGLSPTRIIDDLGLRLRASGAQPVVRPRRAQVLPTETALARQGLRRYDRAVPLTIVTP